MSYEKEAMSDAADTAREFEAEIVENFIGDGKVDDEITAYSDSYHHETHIDKAYDLQEAADLLDDLSEFEEEDEGLWEGQKPREAISTQAAFTYGNAVASYFHDLMNEINDDDNLLDLYEQHEMVEETVDDELEVEKEEYEEQKQMAKAEFEDKQEERRVLLKEAFVLEEFTYEEFEPPFDRDDEIESRKENIEKEIKDAIEEIINNF